MKENSEQWIRSQVISFRAKSEMGLNNWPRALTILRPRRTVNTKAVGARKFLVSFRLRYNTPDSFAVLVMKIQEKLRYLEDRWDERVANSLG